MWASDSRAFSTPNAFSVRIMRRYSSSIRSPGVIHPFSFTQGTSAHCAPRSAFAQTGAMWSTTSRQ
jgi:hypothetical protein